MKRKLLRNKSIKTLKSLRENILQRRNGTTKQIEKKNRKRDSIEEDLTLIEEIILEKRTE